MVACTYCSWGGGFVTLVTEIAGEDGLKMVHGNGVVKNGVYGKEGRNGVVRNGFVKNGVVRNGVVGKKSQ